MTITIPTKLSLLSILFLASSSLYAEELLEDITVEEDASQQEESLSYSSIQNVQALSKRKGAGETLGDYLGGELGVQSATYGSAVGRPTVNGMEGYRVGIAQGGYYAKRPLSHESRPCRWTKC